MRVLSAGDIVDGRFEVAQNVKRGAVSTVYRAIDRHDGDRAVALKLLHALGERQTARFARDAEAFERLRHPRIVAHLKHGTWRVEEPYLVVEWLEGVDLERRLEQPLSLAASVRIGIHVAEALEHAHAHRVVHGQLKPGHVFLTDGDIERVELLDFVSGFLPDAEGTSDNLALASAVGYMAPEQARGVATGPQADLFSLGCLLYRLIGGRAAFEGSSVGAVVVSLLTHEPPPLGALAAIPAELDALIRSLLAKEARLRPSDAASVRSALLSVEAQLSSDSAQEFLPTAPACPSDEKLSEYLEGVLDDKNRQAIEEHIDLCHACSRIVGDYAREHLGPPPGDEPPPSAAAASLGIGATIGRYTIRDVLGMGGVGIVYLADDRQLGRQVALKLLLDTRHGERAQHRMLREARALAQLSHPNVVAVHDAGLFGSRPYLVMEYIAGRRLDVWMREPGRTRDEVIDALLQVGEGLRAAHESGLVHRDVKPANAIAGDDGRVRVVDFGLVRFDAPHSSAGFHTTAGSFLGTPYYMPPEQRAGVEVDARADQYSYCVMMFDALYRAGRARDERSGEDMHSDPNDGVFPVLERGLLMEPDQRHPDMTTLLTQLRAALSLEQQRRKRDRTLPLPFQPEPEPSELYLLIARPPTGPFDSMPLASITHTLMPDEAIRSPSIDAARELAERAGGRVSMLPDGLLTARFRSDRARTEPAATRAVHCALAFLGVLGVPAVAVIADDAPGGELTLEAVGRAEELLVGAGHGAVRVDDRVAAAVRHELGVERAGSAWLVRD